MKIKNLFIFIALFIVIVSLWKYISTSYYHFLSYISTHLISSFYNLDVLKIDIQESIFVTFMSNQVFPFSNQKSFSTMIEISNIDSITFNIPLTMAILISLSISNRFLFREFLEAFFILIIFHIVTLNISILHIFVESRHLEYVLQNYYIPSQENLIKIETFLINYIVKAEPFLIGGFLLFRRGVIKFDSK